jgi:hypothetical protein
MVVIERGKTGQSAHVPDFPGSIHTTSVSEYFEADKIIEFETRSAS